jgi:hypothetical protein
MYCIGCGKKGVHWPKNNPEACSMRCLAIRALAEYSAGGDGFHCPDCGLRGDDQHCELLDPESEV